MGQLVNRIMQLHSITGIIGEGGGTLFHSCFLVFQLWFNADPTYKGNLARLILFPYYLLETLKIYF